MAADASQHDLLGAHGGEELAHREREAIFNERVENAVGVASLGDQPGAPQHREMTGDGWSGDREFRRDLACRKFAALEVLQNLPTGRVGEGFEDVGGANGFVGISRIRNIAFLLNR